MAFTLRRRKRVTCAKCNASHPAIYVGHSWLICDNDRFRQRASKRHRYKGGVRKMQDEKTAD